MTPPRLTCFYSGCSRNPINSHTLSKKSIRNYGEIIKLQVIEHDIFSRLKPKEEKKYFKPCNLAKVSTFPGFCSFHDHSIFNELDNFNGIVTPQIALLSHYRMICYGLYIIEKQQIQEQFLRESQFIGHASKRAKEIHRRIINGFYQRRLMMAKQEYLYRKTVCENLIDSGNFNEIQFICLQGSNKDPLFNGRAGIFFHGLKRRLPLRFLPQMPYITYSSLHNGDFCTLIFHYLSIDMEYKTDLNAFLNDDNFKGKLELLISAHSDFCIWKTPISTEGEQNIREIIDFYH
ncbi:hypothetical protein B1207_15330 [Legionella quinlivanii]|uniref:Uncharacterized protein n=1 Tax=Legionella quinlivanii TaxID=45073 RepID=A0A364LFC9_9GAMM|nr:hypothetical protein B1207_15330 [Legionella quinlivanii]